jgi:hypothetical protein
MPLEAAAVQRVASAGLGDQRALGGTDARTLDLEVTPPAGGATEIRVSHAARSPNELE